ncbi:hypothetical protein QZH41_005573 [Actinostola sp. cb2023]|nr:hypothetical protein QZH41_005573 [Actinostola sp. cb2023]
MDGRSAITIPRVWAIEPLNVSENSIPTKKDIERWPHLQIIDIHMPRDRKVKLLIGCNVPEVFFAIEERRGEPGEPYGVRTPLGWTVFGPSEKISDQTSSQVYFATNEDSVQDEISLDDQSLATMLERFWKSDFGDSLLSYKPCMSIEDSKALAIMEKSVKKVEGHYQVALPWKHQPPSMPNNRVLAEHNPQKPEKLRVVFDCGAKYCGTSLNDQLYQGPDLTNNLLGVLTRFCQDPVAMVADIEAMFHQVQVDPKDQDALRFLWWPNDDLSQEPVQFRMRVHLFGATSSPSCASFGLRKTAEDNRNEFSETVIDSALRNFYVHA